VLPWTLLLPAYSAATVWEPCASAEELRLATPPLRLAGAPKGAPSTTNWTVPSAVTLPGGRTLTVAVKVTFEVVGDGFAEELTAMAVLTGVILAVGAGWVSV
jgi:hypothetical protein